MSRTYYPEVTWTCSGVIDVSYSPYLRHQLFDILSQALSVVEHSLYQGQCCRCSKMVKAKLPDNVDEQQPASLCSDTIRSVSSEYQ